MCGQRIETTLISVSRMIHQEFVISNSKPSSAVLYRGRCWKDSNESLGSQWTTQTYLKRPANVPIREGSVLETVKLKVVRTTAAGMIPQLIHMPINSHWVTAVGEVQGVQRRWDSCPRQDYHVARRQTCISYHSLKEPLQWVSGGEPWEMEINYTTTLKKDAFTIIIKVRYKWKKNYFRPVSAEAAEESSFELRLTYW